MRIAKTNTILKHPINKIFTIENTYHDSNQTCKLRKQKSWQEATRIGELKKKMNINCVSIGRRMSL